MSLSKDSIKGLYVKKPNVLLAAAMFAALFLPSRVLAASFNLPSSFTFAGQSYNQVFLNDNGTLSFGAEYLASGPGLNILAPGAGITGVIAGGFGDYSSSNNWSAAALGNGTKFDFLGTDLISGLDNIFAVSLFNDSTLQFNFTSLVDGSVTIGLVATDPSIPAPQDGGPSALNPYFFLDSSVPGGNLPSIAVLNSTIGAAPLTASPVPEPFTVAGLLVAGGALVQAKRRNASK
jgi:hypothetical protein